MDYYPEGDMLSITFGPKGKAIFCSEPLNRFLNLKDITVPIPVSTFHNPSLQEIVA